MANGVDMMTAHGAPGRAERHRAGRCADLAFLLPRYPWHASNCGELDLTGLRKPQSYYRDILWNGGDRVYATVRLPEPEGKKIIAMAWAVYPTMPTWTWPGQEGKEMQVEVYSGAEKVRLFLNDKLIGEKPTGREQEFKATFAVPYAPGTLKAVGVQGRSRGGGERADDCRQARAAALDRGPTAVQADGQDLSFVTVEALDAEGRLQSNADQEVQFAISGPGVIAAVGNGDGKDDILSRRPAQAVPGTRAGGGPHVEAERRDPVTATAPGLNEGAVTMRRRGGGAAGGSVAPSPRAARTPHFYDCHER